MIWMLTKNLFNTLSKLPIIRQPFLILFIFFQNFGIHENGSSRRELRPPNPKMNLKHGPKIEVSS